MNQYCPSYFPYTERNKIKRIEQSAVVLSLIITPSNLCTEGIVLSPWAGDYPFLRTGSWADPVGGGGGGDRGVQSPPPPLKNHKNIGFLRNTGADPLKNHKATKPAFNVGPSRFTSKMPFKWRFAGEPMMAHL